MRRSTFTPDDVMRRAIETSRSFEEASAKLGLSKSCVRKNADRLGVRTRWRSGREKLPDDRTLRAMMLASRQGGGLAEIKRSLGLSWETIQYHAARLGLDCTKEVRPGLPDDETLRREMLACQRFSDVARRYGVHDHTIRNQARRLGIPSPTKR